MTAIHMVLDSILEKKVRSFLTMLGIIIGVTSVLVLVALVAGYTAAVTAYYEKLGVNKVTISLPGMMPPGPQISPTLSTNTETTTSAAWSPA
jgi:ABC-type antimicrobial peptide transport system permease subunit